MNRPLRVLSIGHSYVVAMNRGILREMANDPNYQVTIGAPLKFNGSLRTIEMEPEPPGSPIQMIGIPAYWTHKMHVFAYDHFSLKRIFKNPFDVLHIWEEPYIFAGFQVARAAFKSGVPFCVRTAQSLEKNYPYPFRSFEKKVFGWCRKWIAGGQLVYQAMDNKGWNGSEKGKILTLAVDTQRFLPVDPIAKKQGLKTLGLEGPLLGYLGRLSEEKGLDLLMEALAAIKDRQWSLLIMGSGPYEEKLKQWAHSEGLSARVRIQLFPHDEIPQVLPLCEMLLCPSQTRSFWKEQFGRMLVEGFASGVPVVASDSGEIPKVVGEAGIILPESDASAWSSAIKKLLADPAERERLKVLGLDRAHKYSAKNLSEEYKAFYHTIAGSV